MRYAAKQWQNGNWITIVTGIQYIITDNITYRNGQYNILLQIILHIVTDKLDSVTDQVLNVCM